MPCSNNVSRFKRIWAATAAIAAIAALAGCGGGGDDRPQVDADAQSFSLAGTISPPGALPLLPPELAARQALPTFHLAPALLDEPDDADALNNIATARMAPRSFTVSPGLSSLSTKRLTLQAMLESRRAYAAAARTAQAAGTIAPNAAAGGAVYTPAQIRAAYGLPSLPATGVTPTKEQLAQMGAGQTIYIIIAYHSPYIASALAAFNRKFGLPTCTQKAIAPTATLPLLPASSTEGCILSTVFATKAGGMSASAPTSSDTGWATEAALDVEWAHAMAPRARIILIESPDSQLDSLLGAIQLANSMGPGIVSMSFGATEGGWVTSVDPVFQAAGMTYLAATGDNGAEVSWPAVSPNVLAVGGTTLSYNGTATRGETAWSGSGGGISAYVSAPLYQAGAPGISVLSQRAVPDVAFNADPMSGQYVAVADKAGVHWVAGGGTSISTPQWAGLIAAGNALRQQGGKAAIGLPHITIYTSASAPGNYASAFADIISGGNGTCGLQCSAHPGFDMVTGLGTPNVAGLLPMLTVTADPPAPTPVAPVVRDVSTSGKAGSPLSFKVSIKAPNAVTVSLEGAPAGVT
ncbi:MAG TPA: S53 family peptidase, partial [Burkholderiaceae bacterium]|nr:S53 family peptidase [Burkholderiaceae bacterium]